MSEIRVKKLEVGTIITNCYLVYNEETKQAVIVDPGDSAPMIIETCEELGVMPEAILLTHGHFDHMMAVDPLREKWSHVKLYSSEAEREVLGDSTKNLMKKWYRKDYTLTPDVTFQDNEEFELIGAKWQMLLTPGHTCGSCCYYLADEEVLFSGDTLFQRSYGRVDLATGDAMQMLASVKRLLTLPDDVMVYPGHAGETVIGFEKKNNPLARY